MAWQNLDSVETLDKVIAESNKQTAFIFKHSNRCSISSLALNRLGNAAKNNDIYIIDVINHRDISSMVERLLSIVHQSPQLLVLQNGKCVHNVSHMGISSAVVERFVT